MKREVKLYYDDNMHRFPVEKTGRWQIQKVIKTSSITNKLYLEIFDNKRFKKLYDYEFQTKDSIAVVNRLPMGRFEAAFRDTIWVCEYYLDIVIRETYPINNC